MLYIFVSKNVFYITVIIKSLKLSRCIALILAEKVALQRYVSFLKLFPQQALVSKGCTWRISRYGGKLSSTEETAI